MRQTLTPILLLLFALALNSCVKERTDNINYFKAHAASALDTTGNVVINEYVARGSSLTNEFGLATDWIELYNTSDSPVNFAHTNYYITDDSTLPEKYTINQMTIAPKGFLVIFCDDSNKVQTQIHTNFGLSKSGSFIGLSKKDGAGNYITITHRVFGAQQSNISEGLYPDGGTTWVTLPTPTPGAPNHL